MGLLHKIDFWLTRYSRMIYYNIRYRLNKWIEIEGVLFPVYLDYGYDVLRFIDSGDYERLEIEIIAGTLKAGDTVMELGTGLGFVSAWCSKKIGSENVYTFEANRFLEPKIRELYNRNGVNPHLAFAILGKEDGKIPFYRNKESLLASSLQNIPGMDLERVEVSVKKLNSVIREIGPSYLIMDIEGGESGIFEEIEFHTIKKIQFELHPTIIGSEAVAKIFSRLKDNGFTRDESFDGYNNYYFYREAT